MVFTSNDGSKSLEKRNRFVKNNYVKSCMAYYKLDEKHYYYSADPYLQFFLTMRTK